MAADSRHCPPAHGEGQKRSSAGGDAQGSPPLPLRVHRCPIIRFFMSKCRPYRAPFQLAATFQIMCSYPLLAGTRGRIARKARCCIGSYRSRMAGTSIQRVRYCLSSNLHRHFTQLHELKTTAFAVTCDGARARHCAYSVCCVECWEGSASCRCYKCLRRVFSTINCNVNCGRQQFRGMLLK